MKISAAVVLASIAGANAFTSPAVQAPFTMSLRMADTPAEGMAVEAMPEEEEAPVVKAPMMSQALPFQQAPAMLDGSMAGDAGFDPLGFAKSKTDLMNYREAEIKHARLAMLAAAGWPISELLDKKLAAVAGLTPVLGDDDRVPSVLNGGLGKVSIAYWITCLVAAAAIDVYGITKAKNSPDHFPGNFGFDPLGLYPKDKEGQLNMQTKELKNGRLAMMGITGFAIQEAIFKSGVVDETPIFFKPLGQALHEYANSGYYVPN